MSRLRRFPFTAAALASLLTLRCDSGSNRPGGEGGYGGAGVSGSGGVPSLGGFGPHLGGLGGDFGVGGGSGEGGSSAGSGGAPALEGCGDGIVQSGEACDDGNGASGDGCADDCSLEADAACPVPGQPCVSTVVCGDGFITGAELCDDGNTFDDDGCSADCRQVDVGWSCLTPGLRCEATACGDGIIAGFEECDFVSPTLGCTNCRVDSGYDCNTLNSGCALTQCGNDVIERGEQCEDGNDQPFDGCHDCKLETSCVDGVCVSACGDGQRFEDEGCDDGNTRSGDGCSSTCTVEVGYTCTPEAGSPAPTLALPIIYRDFIGEGNSLRDPASCYNPVTESASDARPIPCFHIDFNGLGGSGIAQVVESTLGADGRPVYSCPGGDCDQNPGHLYTNGSRPNFNGPEAFAEWYTSSPSNIEIVRSLELGLEGENTYVFDGGSRFYPINDAGWVVLPDQEALAQPANPNCDNNASFTSETHFWFEYQGGEQFEFRGDDDLWVFVNRKLAIDLGGLHVSFTGSFTLDADTDADGPDTADGTADVDSQLGDIQDLDLGLRVGGVYEIVLFHAERNECGSNFKVTLKDFNKPKSVCVSHCGDGVVANDEVCDGGEANNDGGYGHCAEDCLSRGPHCGDGELQAADGEECDDGLNLTGYGAGCAPGCKLPATCGDGVIDTAFGEECDDGVNAGGYDGCAPDCRRAEHCGDGITQGSEQCDDGNRLSGDGCSARCNAEDPR